MPGASVHLVVRKWLTAHEWTVVDCCAQIAAGASRDRELASNGQRARTCARIGCAQHVKKPTAKYCSVQCCAVDPERHARLREQAQRAARSTFLPMARQLTIFAPSAENPEAPLALLCQGREDVPSGMSRFAC